MTPPGIGDRCEGSRSTRREASERQAERSENLRGGQGCARDSWGHQQSDLAIESGHRRRGGLGTSLSNQGQQEAREERTEYRQAGHNSSESPFTADPPHLSRAGGMTIAQLVATLNRMTVHLALQVLMDSVRVSGEVPLRGWKEIAGRLEASEKDSPPTGKPLVAFRFTASTGLSRHGACLEV